MTVINELLKKYYRANRTSVSVSSEASREEFFNAFILQTWRLFSSASSLMSCPLAFVTSSLEGRPFPDGALHSTARAHHIDQRQRLG